jgi:tetratricopeptide (TPR) repeat protein
MKRVSCVAALVISTVSVNLQAAPHCGELENGYGPYDYADSSQRQRYLPIVERFHFTPNVEKLVNGNSGPLGGELDYTLRAFPNHHRALAALAKLAVRDKTVKPVGAKYSVYCYFDRAIRFKPTDPVVRMVYGSYLQKLGQPDKAIDQFNVAVNLQPEDPTINYNLGLLYMQKKDYEQARTHAKKAYELGFPLPGLKNQLIQAGKWED